MPELSIEAERSRSWFQLGRTNVCLLLLAEEKKIQKEARHPKTLLKIVQQEKENPRGRKSKNPIRHPKSPQKVARLLAVKLVGRPQ